MNQTLKKWTSLTAENQKKSPPDFELLNEFSDQARMKTLDVIEKIKKNKITIEVLPADGAGSKNDFLMQSQSNYLQIPIKGSQISKLSAQGVAFISGVHLKYLNLDYITNFKFYHKYFYLKNLNKRIQQYIQDWNYLLQKLVNNE
jgi:glycerol kinase